MKKKVLKDTKDNLGIYKKVESIEKDESDGFVHESDFNQINIDNHGRYHKGPAKTVTVSTNDPRITKPFLRLICGIFFVIGFVFLAMGIVYKSMFHIIFGAFILLFTAFTYYKAKIPMDELEAKLKQYPQYREQEPKDVRKEFVGELKESWNEAKKSTFTKDNFQKFVRVSLPLYAMICLAVFIIISIFVNILLGLAILALLVLCGLFYYWIISKICKW